jgi:cytoskeletal protein RodZ
MDKFLKLLISTLIICAASIFTVIIFVYLSTTFTRNNDTTDKTKVIDRDSGQSLLLLERVDSLAKMLSDRRGISSISSNIDSSATVEPADSQANQRKEQNNSQQHTKRDVDKKKNPVRRNKNGNALHDVDGDSVLQKEKRGSNSTLKKDNATDSSRNHLSTRPSANEGNKSSMDTMNSNIRSSVIRSNIDHSIEKKDEFIIMEFECRDKGDNKWRFAFRFQDRIDDETMKRFLEKIDYRIIKNSSALKITGPLNFINNYQKVIDQSINSDLFRVEYYGSNIIIYLNRGEIATAHIGPGERSFYFDIKMKDGNAK